MTLPPVLALHLMIEARPTVAIDGNRVVMEIEGLPRVSFDRESGALSEFTVRGPDGNSEVRITIQPGLYEKWLEVHEREMSDAKRFISDGKPISTFLEFVVELLPACQEIDHSLPILELTQLGRRLLQKNAFRGLDRGVTEFLNSLNGENRYRLPVPRQTELVGPHPWWLNLVPLAASEFLPRTDQIQIITREFVLSEAVRDYRSSAAFDDLFLRKNAGAMTYRLVALTRHFGSRYSGLLEDIKSADSTWETFQLDFDQWCAEGSPVGQFLEATTAALQESNDDEINAICSLFNLITKKQSLQRIERRLPKARNKPARDVLRSTLWDVLQWIEEHAPEKVPGSSK